MIPHITALHQILTAGIQAPSAENKHYFWLEVGVDTVTLHATDSASWTAQPDRKMLALMSFGAVVENITLRAAAMGLATHARWWPAQAAASTSTSTSTSATTRVVVLSWQTAAPVFDPLDGAISTRHTNRRFYQRAALQHSVLAALSLAANAMSGARVHWLAQGTQRSQALRLIRIAETERFRRAGLHHEMFSAIRFERGWDGTVLEGLPPAALQVEPPMRWPFAWLRHWNVMRAADAIGAHYALGLRAGYLPCALAPHLGLVTADAEAGFGTDSRTGSDTDPGAEPGTGADAAHVQAGRAFQRLWLAAEHLGLALQPMAAATVLTNQISRADWVSSSTQKRLAEGLHALKVDSGTAAIGARACMLFRVGRAQAPSAVAGRRPLEHFLKAPVAATAELLPP